MRRSRCRRRDRRLIRVQRIRTFTLDARILARRTYGAVLGGVGPWRAGGTVVGGVRPWRASCMVLGGVRPGRARSMLAAGRARWAFGTGCA